MIELLQQQRGERSGVNTEKVRSLLIAAENVGRRHSDDGCEKTYCSSCGEIITGEMYTDRFYEVLCRGCLLRLHKI